MEQIISLFYICCLLVTCSISNVVRNMGGVKCQPFLKWVTNTKNVLSSIKSSAMVAKLSLYSSCARSAVILALSKIRNQPMYKDPKFAPKGFVKFQTEINPLGT